MQQLICLKPVPLIPVKLSSLGNLIYTLCLPPKEDGGHNYCKGRERYNQDRQTCISS
ncbi:hypothetical protein LCGC14_2953890 [marine sediment metagenome]|uniref:Uncharacterized protein n=1 Tax=marine sediment metagenome TaxID=412755 RepID=A0A0F8Y1M2_9ZZZZ